MTVRKWNMNQFGGDPQDGKTRGNVKGGTQGMYYVDSRGQIQQFGGGSSGGGIPFGGGSSGGASTGATAGTTAGTAGTSAAAGTGGQVASTAAAQSWWSNPNLWQAAGAAYGIYDSKQQREAAEKARQYSQTSAPWGPSEDHRVWGMNEARRLYDEWNSGRGGNAQGGGGGGGGRGGGGGGQPQQPSIAQQAAQGLMDRANAGHPLYGPGNQTAADLMQGTDPYREGAADRYANMGYYGNNPYLDLAGAQSAGFENPYLARWLDAAMGGGNGAGGGGSRSSRSGGGGGGGGGADMIGAADYIKKMLDADPYARNPALDALIDDTARRIRQEYEETVVPGITSAYEGRGQYGSSHYQGQQAQAAGRFGDSLGSAITGLEYQGYDDAMSRYMEALGLGTTYDLAAMQDATSRAGIGASAASAAESNRLAEQAQMLNAIGMYGDDQRFGVSGLLDTAGLLQNAQLGGAQGLLDVGNSYSAQQLAALGMLPDITGMGIRDLGAAYEAGAGLDALGLERDRLGIERGRLGLARQAQNLQQQAMPFEQLGRFSDILNGMSGNYGYSSGVNPGAAGPSNAQGAMTGAMTAGGLYNQWMASRAAQPQTASYGNTTPYRSPAW